MLIRFQMGADASYEALELSATLMHRLEPDAEIHVVYQGGLKQRLPFITYHAQALPNGEPYCSGRHIPLRLDENQHEAFFDNDHIIWELPEGWKRWRDRDDAVLMWTSDWGYYGAYSGAITENASAGFWGLPPHCIMPFPVYLSSVDKNQDEYGWVVKFLNEWPEKERITQAEVPIYNPTHPAIPRDVIGTHGVHLMSLNRGWSPKGYELLMELRKKYL